MRRKLAKEEGFPGETEDVPLLSYIETEPRKGGKMIMRWLICGAGSIHIVGPCPDCYATEGGLLMGTIASTYKGRVMAKCLDCDKIVDFYVDAQEERIWKLEPTEARGTRVETSPR